jgi:hypothetical protein
VSAVLEEENSSSDWSVFPNPTSSSFTLSISDNSIQKAEITILATDGELISTQTKHFSLTDNRLTINELQTQPTGVYFIKIKSNQGIEILKVIKQ